MIEQRFLDLPPEVLQTSMREHQKFLSARNPKTGRIEGYITVANIETPDHGATVLHGNQRVLAARLSDAAFFWENDLREARAGMGDWAEGLKAVTFHAKLGSQWDRVERIAALAREIAPAVGRTRRLPNRRHGSRNWTCVPRWSASSPNCRAPWAAITPGPPACRMWWRMRQATIIRRWGRRTRCPRRRCPSRWHWPTSWTR